MANLTLPSLVDTFGAGHPRILTCLKLILNVIVKNYPIGTGSLNMAKGGDDLKVYVASSWRNEYQQTVVNAIRSAGHEVYDFKHPLGAEDGFHWSELDPEWDRWTPDQFRRALGHAIASVGFSNDMRGLRWADACVMVQPCGRSAALELGWAVGAGKHTAVLLAEPLEPDLMLNVAEELCVNLDEIEIG